MLIELKVKTELPVIRLFLGSFEWHKQFSDIILGEQRTTQDAHDLHNWATNLHIVFDDTNEAICDDGNMYLDADGILSLTPESLDSKVLLDPLEEQLNLPPISINECNILGLKIEVVSVVCEGTSEFRRVVNDATDRCRIIRLVSLASEADSLVTKDFILPFLKVKSAFNLIGWMKLLSNDKERSRAIDFIEPCKVKIASINT